MNAVELRGVEKRFGAVRALAELTLDVAAGEQVLVRGPNGAGKSTLLRVLAGLTRPSRGEARVLGASLYRSGAGPTRGRIGYLGVDASLYGELTVRENLAFCARLHGSTPARIAEVLAALGLDGLAERRVRTLSSGFRRRAGLARALLPEPDLVLLDEPWNGLDAEAAALLDRQLAALRERRATVLVAAHLPDASAAAYDRALVLEAGRLVP